MKVYCSPYTLTPLKRANRLSSLDKKHGALLKGVLGDKVTFADYFPHVALGDRPTEQFLDEFRFQNFEYDQKVFDLLLRDHGFQNLKAKSFKNHQLWSGHELIEADIVKYKLLHEEDLTFLPTLEKGVRLRLDGNALFDRNGLNKFLSNIPDKFLPLIDYMEDPLKDPDWKDLKLPLARDFVDGNKFDYHIYKPNCEFRPKTEARIIYSSYLGHDLGRWHAYCELVETGDLAETHGIITTEFYEEENFFMKGSFKTSWGPDAPKVQRLYLGLAGLNWKTLCSM